MNGWNYDIETVPEGDARKLVTLEKDGMVWVGVRAFHHADKKWLNNGGETGERVVAWRDMPAPADPRFFHVDTSGFEKVMREEVIPAIEADIERRAKAAANSRRKIIFR